MEEFKQEPLDPVEFNTEKSPDTMFDIVSRSANKTGIMNLDQKTYDLIMEKANLSDEERDVLLQGFIPDVMSPEEKQNLYDSESKIQNAAMSVANEISK